MKKKQYIKPMYVVMDSRMEGVYAASGCTFGGNITMTNRDEGGSNPAARFELSIYHDSTASDNHTENRFAITVAFNCRLDFVREQNFSSYTMSLNSFGNTVVTFYCTDTIGNSQTMKKI